jgi:hypothetical protein
MVWVPSTKVHARFVLSKHVRQKFFHTDKTMYSRKCDQNSGDYGTDPIRIHNTVMKPREKVKKSMTTYTHRGDTH